MVAPLGVVVDEADRQTLVCSHGTAYHRRVGERFLDTLLMVQGETQRSFNLEYGFDVNAPVASARSRLAPPLQLAVTPNSSTPEIGWILHTAPKDILLSRINQCISVNQPERTMGGIPVGKGFILYGYFPGGCANRRDQAKAIQYPISHLCSIRRSRKASPGWCIKTTWRGMIWVWNLCPLSSH